jgi:hypothetical protein
MFDLNFRQEGTISGLLSIIEMEGKPVLVGNSFNDRQISNLAFEPLNLCLRDNATYCLHSGDVFQLGKVEYRIVETSYSKTAKSRGSFVESRTIATAGVFSRQATGL